MKKLTRQVIQAIVLPGITLGLLSSCGDLVDILNAVAESDTTESKLTKDSKESESNDIEGCWSGKTGESFFTVVYTKKDDSESEYSLVQTMSGKSETYNVELVGENAMKVTQGPSYNVDLTYELKKDTMTIFDENDKEVSKLTRCSGSVASSF